MRVIAGRWRGQTLRVPPRSQVRPTSDRVREAIFDMLASLQAVQGSKVVDVFAGTGALGIEALSRGASSVTFVERDRLAAQAIVSNLDRLKAPGESAKVLQADALSWVSTTRTGFDLALCDPPYSFDSWPVLLSKLPARLAVLESSRPLDLGEGWEVFRVRRYGSTLVTLVNRSFTAHPDPTATPHFAR
ncbi:MAG: 16S rRNA (guanine(966)-N(2))-methyltransferase RsmD [Actinobacteria bacterium]|nr:16S rRNA (guanine(966)-N(2))-methyltransferase RsmD [Actinomycetota bacterium]